MQNLCLSVQYRLHIGNSYNLSLEGGGSGSEDFEGIARYSGGERRGISHRQQSIKGGQQKIDCQSTANERVGEGHEKITKPYGGDHGKFFCGTNDNKYRESPTLSEGFLISIPPVNFFMNCY